MDFLFYVWQCLSFLYRPLPMKSIATFHIPHREVGMFFLHIGEVCVTHTCHSGLSELLSFFSRERPQTFLLPQRSHIASPNLQRRQVSPSLYFRGSVCRLPGFENFSSSLLVVSQNSRVPPPKCWSGPEAVPLHSKKKKTFQKCQVPWVTLTQNEAAQSWQRQLHLQTFATVSFSKTGRLC